MGDKMTQLKDVPEGTGLSGVIQLKRADGTVEQLYINSTRNPKGDNNGNTSAPNSGTKHDR